MSSDLDRIRSSVCLINALQIVCPGGEGGNVPRGLEVFGTIGLEPERTSLDRTWLAYLSMDFGVRQWVAHILVLLGRGDVTSTQPVHEIDLAHHLADVPGDLEGEQTAGDSTSVLQKCVRRGVLESKTVRVLTLNIPIVFPMASLGSMLLMRLMSEQYKLAVYMLPHRVGAAMHGSTRDLNRSFESATKSFSSSLLFSVSS